MKSIWCEQTSITIEYKSARATKQEDYHGAFFICARDLRNVHVSFYLEFDDEIGRDDKSPIFDHELFVFDVNFSFNIGKFHPLFSKFVQSTATVTRARHANKARVKYVGLCFD